MRKIIQMFLIISGLALLSCNNTKIDLSPPTQTLPPATSPLLTPTKLETDISLFDLVHNNGGCSLPCFWGITPGITTWENADEFLSGISYWDAEYITYWVEADETLTTNKAIVIYIDYKDFDLYNNGIVDYIWVERQKANYIPDILKNLGEPKEIWIETRDSNPEVMHNKVPFKIYLFYPDLGIRLTYITVVGEVHDNFISGCIEGSPSIELWTVT